MSDQMKYLNKLESTRILVVGGTSGIGFSAAEASLESGATVIISSSNTSRIDQSLSRLKSSYPSKASNISGYPCDLGKDATLESNIEALLKSSTDNGTKRLDHIVFTAADSLAIGPLKENNLQKMHDAGRIRFFAPLLIGKYASDYLKSSASSSITFTTGAVAERPMKDWAVIGAFATGIIGIGKELALELAPIRVNVVSPGLVDTELWKEMTEEQKTKMYEQVAAGLPTGQVATPEMIAETYLYLMKDHNVTGSLISTNGGTLLK